MQSTDDEKPGVDPGIWRAFTIVALFWLAVTVGVLTCSSKSCNANAAGMLCEGVRCTVGISCGRGCSCLTESPGDWGTCVSLGRTDG